MRLKRLSPSVILALAAFCAGCGSTSYQDSARSSVHDIGSAIQTYNQAVQHDVQSTGQACSQAYDSVKGHAPPAPPPAGQKYHAEGKLLNATFRIALQGFSHCESGATAGSFPTLQMGVTEIAMANRDLARLKRMDSHAVVR